VDHAVDAFFDADEDTVVGDAADLAADLVAGVKYFSVKSVQGSGSSCLKPSEMRLAFASTSSTWHSISWPTSRSFDGCLTFLVQLISLTWMRPSTPGSSSTKAP
jgi:hypothetical protein